MRSKPRSAARCASIPKHCCWWAISGCSASVIAFSLYNVGVVRVGSASAGYFGNLFPVFSALLAVVFLGEIIAWYHALGGFLVLGGIYLATVPAGALRRRAAG